MWDEWKTPQNVPLLLSLADKADISEENRKWFETHVTTGIPPKGPTLAELGVTQESFGDPLEPIRKMMKTPEGAFAYLKVLYKMMKVGALARLPRGCTKIRGEPLVTIPMFTIIQKGKPRLVANFAKRVKIDKEAAGDELAEWLENPVNRQEWDRNLGELAYNSLIDKEEKTLSYADLVDLASVKCGLGPGAYYMSADVSASYYQMVQHEKKLAYQRKELELPWGETLSLLLRGNEMGDAGACAKGNLDTLTKLFLAEADAKSSCPQAMYRLKYEELVPPSEYDLKEHLLPYDLKRIRERMLSKKQNELACMHTKKARFFEYRWGTTMMNFISYQDDMELGRRNWEEALALTTHFHDFCRRIRWLLSTLAKAPDQEGRVFCGIWTKGPIFGFTPEKWNDYGKVVDEVTLNETSSAQEILRLNGVLANSAALFPLLKIPLGLVSHHFASQIRLAIGAKKNAKLRVAWRKLLPQRFVVAGVLKEAVRNYWGRIKNSTVHARNFLVTAGDAKSERVISVDAEPDGIGIVKHDSYQSWGVKLDRNKSRLTGTRPVFGSISSTGFETSGTALAVEVVPELTKVHTGEFPVVYRCYQDNQGAERLIDPLNPKFRGDAFAANMLIQEKSHERNFMLMPDRLDTKTIPADAPSRLKNGMRKCMAELRRRRVLTALTMRARATGEKSPLLEGLKGASSLLDKIASFLGDLRPRNQRHQNRGAAPRMSKIHPAIVKKVEREIMEIERKYFPK